jgi:DNA-directed RNA polymerase specialized sigma24 family protein
MNERSEPTTDTAEPLAGDARMDSATEVFVTHRNLLFTVAYEMLGSATYAEDVLQETWLRWMKVDMEQVRDQRACLVRITTRRSLDRLRTMSRRKEDYVGSWLPEPLLTAPDVAEDVELAESVSMALMIVLETLSPTERAALGARRPGPHATAAAFNAGFWGGWQKRDGSGDQGRRAMTARRQKPPSASNCPTTQTVLERGAPASPSTAKNCERFSPGMAGSRATRLR